MILMALKSGFFGDIDLFQRERLWNFELILVYDRLLNFAWKE